MTMMEESELLEYSRPSHTEAATAAVAAATLAPA